MREVSVEVTYKDPETLAAFQREINDWSTKNFGAEALTILVQVAPFLGMVEELGEIAHAILKSSQGIRGSKEYHFDAIKDGVADLLIYTLDFCARNDMDAEALLTEVWKKVKQRDWKKHPNDAHKKVGEET